MDCFVAELVIGRAFARPLAPRNDGFRCQYQNGLLKNRDPFNPYRHGKSTALVMPIRTPITISGFSIRACSAIGG